MGRARLPGADELFRPTGPRHERGAAEQAPTVDVQLLTELVELAASEAGEGAETPGTAGAVGHLLAWTAATVGARHLVEVAGTVPGTALWLLRGAGAKAVLTRVAANEADEDAARRAFDAAGVGGQVRAMRGDADELLARLADGGYDLVLLAQPNAAERPIRTHALRLLRPGGVLVALDVATDTGDLDRRERRALVRDLIEDDRLSVAVLPVSGGVVVARLAAPDED